MRLVLVTVGTLGDTAPYIGLGARLKEAGHEVAIAAHEAFADLIRGAGLEFRPLPGDMRAELTSPDGRRLHEARSWVRALRPSLRVAVRMMADLSKGLVEATEGADVLLVHRLALVHGYLLAKARGIPLMVFELFPSGIAPTAEFLPAVMGPSSLGTLGNRAVYRLLRASARRTGGPLLDSLRLFAARLGLPRDTALDLYQAMDAERWPIYHAFSPTVVPRPADWRDNVEVIGYFWPVRSPEWRPPARLLDFLAAGPPPIYIGFGSVMPGETERLSALIRSAVGQARVRAVVQAPWLDVGAQGDDLLPIDGVPHDWLFPRMTAVVHAAGAGTTGATLRAGVPAVPVPVMFDQPFWADRLVRLGVSPGWVRFQKLSAPRLGSLIEQAVAQPRYRTSAEQVAQRLRAEDGPARVVAAIERLAC